MKRFPDGTGMLRIVGSMLLLILASCSTRVEYLTDAAYPAGSQDRQVQWLPTEPSRPYIELASITVSGSLLSQDTLRNRILDRARQLGADAVMNGGTAIVSRTPVSPYFEPGLLGPAGAAFHLYGYGWYTPYASNPYLLTQGSADQPRQERYVSGVAIRYLDEPGEREGR
ncbi:MAG: hypothetical protein KF814_08030 [Nitrospiraceae bacterium]|nr:hypothetical protein [Nitrospiraceae bacterium]